MHMIGFWDRAMLFA